MYMAQLALQLYHAKETLPRKKLQIGRPCTRQLDERRLSDAAAAMSHRRR